MDETSLFAATMLVVYVYSWFADIAGGGTAAGFADIYRHGMLGLVHGFKTHSSLIRLSYAFDSWSGMMFSLVSST